MSTVTERHYNESRPREREARGPPKPSTSLTHFFFTMTLHGRYHYKLPQNGREMRKQTQKGLLGLQRGGGWWQGQAELLTAPHLGSAGRQLCSGSSVGHGSHGKRVPHFTVPALLPVQPQEQDPAFTAALGKRDGWFPLGSPHTHTSQKHLQSGWSCGWTLNVEENQGSSVAALGQGSWGGGKMGLRDSTWGCSAKPEEGSGEA